MKKKILALLSLPLIAALLGGCNNNNQGGNDQGGGDDSGGQVITTKYTVAFEVDGTRYKTLKVEENHTISDTVVNPSKEGYTFVGWMNGTTQVDLATFVVTADVTLTAKFEENKQEDVLNVDDVKDPAKAYSLVIGWWECQDSSDPTKKTSYLTKDIVRSFYANLINYLKATGFSDDQVASISFRNYSSATVADMGTAINNDGDVSLVIGAGANVFTTAGCLPFNESSDSKFNTEMGVKDDGSKVSRYVAILSGANETAQETYKWLQTDTGKKSFVSVLTDEEIKASLVKDVIELTVTVHGDTDAVTTLSDEDTAITMPIITVPDGKEFKGFATSADGEVVLAKDADASLKYADLKSLVTEGSKTLDLYPVFADLPVAQEDLVVHIQVSGSYLYDYEAKLVEARFEAATGKDIKVVLDEGDAAAFTSAVEGDSTCDVVVGGNNPIKNFSAYADGALANTGAKHFLSTNRKVAILSSVNADHVELAKQFYTFMTSDASELNVHVTFWTKGGSWVTADEETAIKSSIEANLKSSINSNELDAYNITLSYYDATNTKVAALGEETKALRDGKGTDLIVGCGANVVTTGLIECEHKDIPASIVAAGRQVGLVNSNYLTQSIYDNCFNEKTAE